jgi:hypothetical protein
MSSSHRHQHGAECQHDDDGECEHEHGAAAAAAANATAAESSPVASSASGTTAAHTHSHTHGGNSSSLSSQPCDYCSSIKAHGKAQKAATREEARRLAERRIANHAEAKASERMGGRPLAPPPDDWSDEEEDDEYKLVLPAQRISLPAVSTRIKQIIGGVFVLLVLRVVRGIVLERRRG